MKKIVTTLILLASSLGSLQAQTFTLKSTDLGGQATIKEVFNGFGCTGQNISPQLYWENPPANTKSYALTIHDPDAPTGSGWWHWIVFDIPTSTLEIPAGAGNPNKDLLAEGAIQSLTDFGTYGYGGPCPPEGDKPHQYIITLYALATDKLGLDNSAHPALVGFYLNANVIAKTSLVFYYNR